MSDKPQKHATATTAWVTISITGNYLPKLFFKVYGHRVMVKSMPCCCVHGASFYQIQSQILQKQISHMLKNFEGKIFVNELHVS